MHTMGEKKAGRFNVEVELANNVDVIDAQRGLLDPDKVRRLRILGVVDSGATRLVLPQDAVKKLGLISTSKVKVRYANHHTSTRPRVEGVHLDLMGRHSVFSATVEPKRDTALIGAIVLEELDFLIDCTKQRLYPRDPNMILSEAE